MDAESERFALQEFLEQFRQSLRVQDPATEKDLASSLLKYGQFCEEANHRLRECLGLVQRGQYSNAVARAEQEPNLLDRCALLEIPERDLLATVAQVVGTRPPTLLNRDLVATLQDAYQKGSTSTDNLRRLHRLTLARAPLPTRLAVMRRLLVQDPNHPFMDADIRTFERAWFKQAVGFVQPFVKEGRPEVIQEIVEDLLEGGYLETPPDLLIANLRTHLARAQAAQLPMLAAEIRRAFAERSLLALAQLAERWRSLTAGTGPPGADVGAGVAEALDWLTQSLEEERRNQERAEAKSRLTELIQAHDTKRLDLEIAYQSARTLGVVDPHLERQVHSRLEQMDRRRKTLQVGSAVAAVAVVAFSLLVVVLSDSTPGPARRRGRVKAAIEPGGVVRASEAAREERGRGEGEVNPPEPGGGGPSVAQPDRNADFEGRLIALREASGKLLAAARRGGADGGSRGQVEELRKQLTTLREQARQASRDEADLAPIEKTLTAVEAWRALSASLAAFQKQMEGARGTDDSLRRLARFLTDEVASSAPDPELARRARLAQASLPTWLKTREVQEVLQSGAFLSRPISLDPWQGQPPAGALAVAADYADMIRHRDASSEGSEAFRVRERLGRMDIVNLWMIRRTGDSARYYTKEQPAAGDAKITANVLLSSLGREERVPFVGRRQVARAPQSIFAEQAAKLWGSSGSDEWDERLADVSDALFESNDMDPLLKLDLVRRFLGLAVRTSAGYRETVQAQAGFKEVTGREGLITGNWLDPGEELDEKREQAGKLIAKAPRLRRHAADAAARDEQRLAALKQALVVVGWIGRDGEARPVLARFEGARPAAGSRLETVVNGEWINLGAVSADGREFRVNETAEQYVGWPVFALLSLQ
jgi:hypothetical protein